MQVKTVVPPAGASPGDLTFLSGGTPNAASAVKQLKSDDWKKIVGQLSVQVWYYSHHLGYRLFNFKYLIVNITASLLFSMSDLVSPLLRHPRHASMASILRLLEAP